MVHVDGGRILKRTTGPTLMEISDLELSVHAVSGRTHERMTSRSILGLLEVELRGRGGAGVILKTVARWGLPEETAQDKRRGL